MKKQVKYLTREMLMECAVRRDDPGWKFNRQVRPDMIPDGTQIFPIWFEMLHEQRDGVKCEPHHRLIVMVKANGTSLTVDVPVEFYRRIPTQEVDVD